MKRFIAFLILLVFVSNAHAQAATHSAVIKWTDPSNPPGTTYTVLRSTGLCSGTPAFTSLATGITVMSYTDTTVTPGNYCYAVEATSNGVLSAPSNSALAPVPAFAPVNVTVVVS